MRILGIDPGSRITGYGIIDYTIDKANKLSYVDCGVINIVKQDLATRLGIIFQEIQQKILQYKPNIVAIEDIFVHINPRGALKLGQARGAAIVAAVSQGLPIAEYTARKVKQTVVGYGGAVKEQVAAMVKILLNIVGKMQHDATDALAVAICHAHSSKINLLTNIK